MLVASCEQALAELGDDPELAPLAGSAGGLRDAATVELERLRGAGRIQSFGQ